MEKENKGYKDIHKMSTYDLMEHVSAYIEN